MLCVCFKISMGLPSWCSGWESACRCRGHGFEPWSGRIPHAAEQLGPCATATEPAPWSLCSTSREATATRSPCTATKSGPRSPQLEKDCTEQQRPNTAKNKINKINKFIKKKNPWYITLEVKWIYVYNWPLNNTGFHCASPLIHGFFSSKYYSTTWWSQLVESADVEPWIWRADYENIVWNIKET